MPKKNQARLTEQALPEIKDGISICRVGVARGGSQFEVSDGEISRLAELPKRFRNVLWIRRGSHVLVETTDKSDKGEIIFVLQKDHIAELKRQGVWPLSLDESREPQATETHSNEDLGSANEVDNEAGDSDSGLFQNPNRR